VLAARLRLGLNARQDVEYHLRLELGTELTSLPHRDSPSDWTYPPLCTCPVFGAQYTRLPLRILVFDRRNALVDYHRQALTNLWNLDGLYASGPWRTITLSTEEASCRFADPERTARMLFSYYVLEAYKGSFPCPWLRQGVANTLAGGEGDALARLNRKMVASLSNGTALGADLFHLESSAAFRLLRGWYDRRNFTKFNSQSWSLVEFLGGIEASEERQGQFRVFLKAIRSREPDEAVFKRHFGHGFDRLIELWKAWVLDRGVGTHEQPPPRILDALAGRIVPIIRDHRAKLMDRVLAVREMGRLGFVVGTDALIDLLREPGEMPKEEVVWSLEAISGLVLGDDPDRWGAWFSGLPREDIGETAAPPLNPVS